MDIGGPIAAIVIAALGGGLGAWLNHLRGSRMDRVDGFERFYGIWKPKTNDESNDTAKR